VLLRLSQGDIKFFSDCFVQSLNSRERQGIVFLGFLFLGAFLELFF